MGAATDNPNALSLHDVTVTLDGKTVLDGFNLGLLPGERVTISGPSGVGKSTVLRCLLGFVVPETGSVHIQGRQLDKHSVWDMRRQLAYVPQEADPGSGTVREILQRPFGYRALRHDTYNEPTALALLERFGLDASMLAKQILQLSGGEKQRIALIAAILLNRGIYLLDEPSSALDPASEQAVAEYFRSRQDLTVLSVCHNPATFDVNARVVTLEPGGAA